MLEKNQKTAESPNHSEQELQQYAPINTLEFLEAILPEKGIYYLALFKEGVQFPSHRAYTDLESMAIDVDRLVNNTELSIYHACASYQNASIQVKEGDKTKHKYRVAENWNRAKAFWVDIDCGQAKFDKGDGYLTKKEAVLASNKFAATVGWPLPMVVDSGNGIHLYWPLTKDISAEAWRKVAFVLKAALSHEGILADPTRTADFASILRPVGSANRKYGGAKQVVAQKLVEPSEPKELAVKLKNYALLTGLKLVNNTKRREHVASDVNKEMTAQLKQSTKVQIDANLIADKCAQAAAMRDTKGDVGYEQWRGVIGLLTYCEKGKLLAEEWTSNREATGHTSLDWNVKFETWGSGPTTCEFFQGCNPRSCEGCEFKGKVKTPLVLGRQMSISGAASVVSRSALLEKLPDWHRNTDGIALRPMMTTPNLVEIMKLFGWDQPRYNELTKRTEMSKTGLSNSRPDKENAALTLLGDDVIRTGMSRVGLMELVEAIAGENSYNPCRDWVESIPWDGVSRLPMFYETLELVDVTTAPLTHKLMDSWMLQAIGALVEPDGISAQGVLTLVAPQARNKTRWVDSLCPVPGAVRTGMHIDPLNKDSVFAATGAWITEAGELDTTTRKSDVGALKAFFTRSKDVLRPPYAKRENEYRRRTVFVGTVNGTGFLHDTTGNRRYWTISVNGCKLLSAHVMQQVWAEYLFKYQKGDRWYLDDATQKELNTANLDHTSTEPLRELIATSFDWRSIQWSTLTPENWRAHIEVNWLTATEICTSVGYIKVTRNDATRAGAIVRELQQVSNQGSANTQKEIVRYSNGSKLLAVPKAAIKKS